MRRLPPIVAPITLVLATVLWTMLAVFSLWMQRQQLDRTAEALARIDAVANLRKDMAIRKWAAQVGGVFISEAKAPNIDNLTEQERVVATNSLGETFKLVSLTPIHTLLGIQEISNKEFGRKERLTSMQLHNSANAPDDWEAQALKSLEKGASMVTEAMPRKGGHGLLRVMIPMRMDEECIECHRNTLVPVGGLRGGAAISLDLNAYRSAQEPTWRAIQYWHAGIWPLGLVAIYGFWYFSRRRAIEQGRNEEELQRHRQQLEESGARLRALAAFLQTVREEERTRIARELHDELGQALTALRIDLGWLRNKCTALGTPVAERATSTLSVVEQSIVSLRRISEDLRPAMLDSLGLAAAIEHHVTQFSQRTGIPCDLVMNREEFDLNDDLATAVFRIIQEALTNVARHADADEVSVQVDETDDAIRLTVRDNGCGFVPNKDKKTFGLIGMRERATMLGGSLDIDSQPGQGTCITGWLPLRKEPRT